MNEDKREMEKDKMSYYKNGEETKLAKPERKKRRNSVRKSRE